MPQIAGVECRRATVLDRAGQLVPPVRSVNPRPEPSTVPRFASLHDKIGPQRQARRRDVGFIFWIFQLVIAPDSRDARLGPARQRERHQAVLPTTEGNVGVAIQGPRDDVPRPFDFDGECWCPGVQQEAGPRQVIQRGEPPVSGTARARARTSMAASNQGEAQTCLATHWREGNSQAVDAQSDMIGAPLRGG